MPCTWHNVPNRDLWQVLWIVEFYSDHCPFCKSLAPELVKAATKSIENHGNKIRFGGLNSRVFHEVAERFNITGYPWVSCFFGGDKTDDMAGLGGADSIINWANKKVEQHRPTGEASTPSAAPAPSVRDAGSQASQAPPANPPAPRAAAEPLAGAEEENSELVYGGSKFGQPRLPLVAYH